jgi:hypothetical protein
VELSELPALYNLTNLESFYYSPNSVTEDDILELERQLPDCDMYSLETEEDEDYIHDDDDDDGCGDGCGCGHSH